MRSLGGPNLVIGTDLGGLTLVGARGHACEVLPLPGYLNGEV